MVSVIAEWHRNRAYLKRKLLRIPNNRPIASDEAANTMKFPIMVKGVLGVKSCDLKPLTVLKRIMLTMSLNTPSPYTIENNLG